MRSQPRRRCEEDIGSCTSGTFPRKLFKQEAWAAAASRQHCHRGVWDVDVRPGNIWLLKEAVLVDLAVTLSLCLLSKKPVPEVGPGFQMGGLDPEVAREVTRTGWPYADKWHGVGPTPASAKLCGGRVFPANTWSNMHVWIGVCFGGCISGYVTGHVSRHFSRHISRHVSAMFRRYMTLDARDVAGVCFGVCVKVCIQVCIRVCIRVCIGVCIRGSNMHPDMNSWHAIWKPQKWT